MKNPILDSIVRQPVRFAALVAIAINIGVSFGLALTGEQVSLLNAFVVTALGLIVPGFVTPTSSPRLDQGTQVEVVTPAGEPNTTTTL
jgi:hypothetical protein